MRGKRASSIGNGFQSLPHPDIPATEFYKHISEALPDPVRMKQLLAWCARRIMDDSKRPVVDSTETAEQIQAAQIAKTIEEEVLKDLIDNKITTSWYHRDEQDEDHTEKRPHPQNIANAQKLKEIEERLQALLQEEESWKALLETKPIEEERFAKNSDQIDLDLLSAQEAEFVHSLSTAPVSASQANDDWLREAESNLEFQVDSLLHSLHRHQQALLDVDATSSRLLKCASQAVAQLDSHKKPDQIDVLRALSRT